jgi:hypothetical protein
MGEPIGLMMLENCVRCTRRRDRSINKRDP